MISALSEPNGPQRTTRMWISRTIQTGYEKGLPQKRSLTDSVTYHNIYVVMAMKYLWM